MNDAGSVLEHSLHLLEHWLGQKSGRTHRTVTARRGKVYFRGGPFTPK